MSPNLRLGLILLVVALGVAAVAWWQWPAAEPAPVVEATEEPTKQRAERIAELRAAIERELAALEAARETRAETEVELRELRESIGQRQGRIEELREQAAALDGGG